MNFCRENDDPTSEEVSMSGYAMLNRSDVYIGYKYDVANTERSNALPKTDVWVGKQNDAFII